MHRLQGISNNNSPNAATVSAQDSESTALIVPCQMVGVSVVKF